MGPLDNEFFEEYKRLDWLCSDMYSCKNGVSRYIEDMESRSRREASSILVWYTDYKLLKHLRWIRNRIAHETDNYQISSESDLQNMRDFYERILSGQDPIALLEKSKADGSCREENVQALNDQKNMQYSYSPNDQKSFASGCLVRAAVVALVFIAVGAVAAIAFSVTL